mmetsp:Transcript_19350/g.48995  ORF Transcript_19350/g.48995 Transcript_19350/m.48995 type:complete len:220 (-) Transcript_19350:505-1164(-)
MARNHLFLRHCKACGVGAHHHPRHLLVLVALPQLPRRLGGSDRGLRDHAGVPQAQLLPPLPPRPRPPDRRLHLRHDLLPPVLLRHLQGLLLQRPPDRGQRQERDDRAPRRAAAQGGAVERGAAPGGIAEDPVLGGAEAPQRVARGPSRGEVPPRGVERLGPKGAGRGEPADAPGDGLLGGLCGQQAHAPLHLGHRAAAGGDRGAPARQRAEGVPPEERQ